MQSTFDLTPLRKALEQLRIALDYAQEALDKDDERLYSVFRMSAIHAFEYCYELTLRTIKRYHEHFAPTTENIDDVHFREFMRISAEAGIIRDPLEWLEYRKSRNSTSHTYDEKKAREVMHTIPAFMAESLRILAVLEERTRAS